MSRPAGTELSAAALAHRAVAGEPRLPTSRLVTIDGPAGAGKTSLAEQLASALPSAAVVHLDDLYEGWGGLNQVLFTRLEAWLLAPLQHGLPVRHLVYDWDADSFRRWREVPAADVLVLEGVGAGHPVTRAAATLSIHVHVPVAAGMRRALARDGHGAHWTAWQRAQESYLRHHDPAAAADIVLDGSPPDHRYGLPVLRRKD